MINHPSNKKASMTFCIATALAAALLLQSCSDKTAARQRLDERFVAVGIMAVQWEKSVAAKSDFKVKVAVQNSGGAVIPSLSESPDGALRVYASYHWKGTDNKVVVWDGVLTPLPADLAPGVRHEMELSVRAPDQPGVYVLEVDLVQATAFWFGGAGSQTAAMLIAVR